jgi:hypothetical protein
MADEDVTGRGGSLILTCHGGKKELKKVSGPNGEHKYQHPSKGKIYSVEVVNDGAGNSHPPIDITGSEETEIVIRYRLE